MGPGSAKAAVSQVWRLVLTWEVPGGADVPLMHSPGRGLPASVASGEPRMWMSISCTFWKPDSALTLSCSAWHHFTSNKAVTFM